MLPLSSRCARPAAWPGSVRSHPVHRNVRAVVEAGAARGLTLEPRAFREGTKTAADAAAAIGVDVGQIVKSLVFLVDGEPVMALVAGDNQLDERNLAAAPRRAEGP